MSPQSEESSHVQETTETTTEKPKEENQLWCCCCCIDKLVDRQTALIILCAVLYFVPVTITAIPLKLLMNKRIAGDAEEPSSESTFVDNTTSIIHAFVSFFTGRYTSGLSDFTGRKPVLILSTAGMILSRIIYLSAHSPGMFYVGALVGGILDCFYFTSLSWICDVFPEGTRRSKRIGMFTGVVGGLAFTLGVPIGAVFAEIWSPEFTLKLSIVLAMGCIVALILVPVDDTMCLVPAKHVEATRASLTTSRNSLNIDSSGRASIISRNSLNIDISEIPRVIIWGKRSLPAELWTYLKLHFPISMSSFALMYKAEHPLDWLTNFLMHANTSLLYLILIQYCLAVYGWSGVQAAGSVLSIGICVGIFSPVLLHRYSPIPLAFRAMSVFTTGLIVLSVSGTGIENGQYLGIAGIVMFALGTSWIPALQTNLLSQYSPDIQGAVSGLLSQQKDLTLVPAYIMSLGFTVHLGRDGPMYWPGSAFGAAAVLGVLSVGIHFHIHREDCLKLTFRTIKDDPLRSSDHQEDCTAASTVPSTVAAGHGNSSDCESGSESDGSSGKNTMSTPLLV